MFITTKKCILTIKVEQSLCIMSFDEHQCLENINKLYRNKGRCDDKQHCKYTIETAMVYTTE